MQLSTSTGLSQRYEVEVKSKTKHIEAFLDNLLLWLESEDSPLDKILGYGLCIVTFLFLCIQIIRFLI